MDETKKQKLLKAIQDGKITDESTLAVFQMCMDMEDQMSLLEKSVDKKVSDAVKEIEKSKLDLPEVLKSVVGKQGEKGDSVTGPQGPQGVQGPKGESIVGPQGPTGPQGPAGESIVGPAGKDADESAILAKIENNLPSLGEKMRDGLELLEGDNRLDVSAIKGLDEKLAKIKKPSGGGVTGTGARDLIKDIDLSAQLNGVLTTFNIQSIWNVISVNLSSYPYGSLRKNIDYTWTPTSITFTSTIDPTTQLSAGQQCILTVVQG